MKDILPGETPAMHFRRCGPMCLDVKFCDECMRVHWVCDEHASDPDKSITWRAQPPPVEGPKP